ncbi:hypothetical protein CRUP_008828 [Coryphaenoides rupestris]|nr:hypothetical protein CRUP_008828 [Coryphaenoides rupestris]
MTSELLRRSAQPECPSSSRADQLVTDGDERRKGMREMKGTMSGVMRLTIGIPPIAVLPCLDVSGVTMALCLLTLLLMTLRGRRMAIHHRHRLRHLPLPPPPPGPTPWPFVGNLLQMGGQQALVRQGGAFAGRPDLFTFSAVANGTSMTFSEKYGPAWTLHKKLCKQALMSLCRAEPLGLRACEHICAEAAGLVEAMQERASSSSATSSPRGAEGKEVEEEEEEEEDRRVLVLDPALPLVSSVANVVCALCFGKRYAHGDREFLSVVRINNEVLRIFAAGNLADFFPVFRYFPSPSLRKLDHIRDITDALIAQCEERGEDQQGSLLSNSQIIHTWSLLYLIKFPDTQNRIHQEIDEHIGPARVPRFADKPKMPFTEAFLYEVFRHASYVPLTIPHW